MLRRNGKRSHGLCLFRAAQNVGAHAVNGIQQALSFGRAVRRNFQLIASRFSRFADMGFRARSECICLWQCSASEQKETSSFIGTFFL
jgi:hypothetical protein